MRKNGELRGTPRVRLIGAHGEKLGVVPLAEALRLALAEGLDLVEINPKESPPLCKLLDFSKYSYGAPGSMTCPDGFCAGPDGSIAGPGGFCADPGGSIAGPGGFCAGPDGSIAGPGGFCAGPDGSIAGPSGFCAGPARSCAPAYDWEVSPLVRRAVGLLCFGLSRAAAARDDGGILAADCNPAAPPRADGACRHIEYFEGEFD